MKVAIIGTRGIPNFYGGFEQFAEYFSLYLVSKGHEVYVYCPHNHPHKQNTYLNVKLVKCFDPEFRIGTIGQFIYDFNCIRHSRRLRPDVILNLGYTSSAVFMWMFRKDIPVITNMDGLEWKRSKYSKTIQRFIKYSEGLAVKKSTRLVSDSKGIKEYLLQEYGRDSVYIPYGAHVISDNPSEILLSDFNLKAYSYNLLIARMEPENNLEPILEGIVRANCKYKTIVVGNFKNGYGQYLFRKFEGRANISFFGSYYDLNKLNALRFFCNIYFHGHSVGGTNPSLIEAMASSAFICAHDNKFNRHVLGNDALYFSSAEDIERVLRNQVTTEIRRQFISNNLTRITTEFNWPSVNVSYEEVLKNESGKGK